MSYNLWKPVSDSNGNAVVLFTQNMGDGLVIQDADTGRVIEAVTFDTIANGGRYHYRLKHPGSYYKNVFIIGDNGQGFYVGDGSKRNESFTLQTFTKNSSHIRENGGPQYDVASGRKEVTGNISDEGYSNVYGIKGVGNVAAPQLLDPASLGKAQIEFTDPIDTLRNIAKENKGQLDANFITSLAQAGVLNTANAQMLTDYLDMLSPQQQQLIGIENAFNQKQQIKAAESAQPGITDLLRGEVKNAQTLASGRLLRDAEDRALEQTARSAGADAAWTRGLGDDSLVGKRLSDQLSVSQRLGLMQQGQNYMNTAVQLANQTLMDTPNKAALSQQISGAPQRTISDITSQQWQIWNNGTTLSPEAVQGSIVQQRTKQADLDTSLQSMYNKYMYDIMAANTQAINTQNQDILNDQANTAASERRSLAYQQAALAFANGLVDKGEYEQILAQIEQTGTVDLSTWSDQWKDWYDNYLNADKNEREKERDRLSRENSDRNSGRVPSKPEDNTQNGTGGSAGEVGGGNDTIYRDKPAQQEQQQRQENTPNNKFLLINSNGQSSKIIDNSGYINLPERNQNFNYNMSYWEYLNTELDDTDLSGVF